MKRWNPVDVVQLLIHLRLKRARKLFQWLPSDPAAKIVAALMEEATLARYAELLNAQDPETAAKHLDAVPEEMVAAVLPRLKAVEEIRSHRAYREDSAGSVMTRRFVAVPADWSVDPALATGVFITTGNEPMGVLVFFLMVSNVYFACAAVAR